MQAQTDNTATGWGALINNTTGGNNSAFGADTLAGNTTGGSNSAFGADALAYNTTGYENTAIGYWSLASAVSGNGNTAVGALSLFDNEGNFNTALGIGSLYSNVTGYSNTASVVESLRRNTTGNYNMGIGEIAGFSNSTGSNNVFIGRSAGFFETGSNKLYISSLPGTPLIYGEFSATAANNKLGIAVTSVPAGDAISVWNGARLTVGGVWTNASSRELKDGIEPLSIADANKTLAGLSPVRYVYTNSPDEEYVGFIAEDVPELVASNDRKSLSPMDIVAVLTTVTKEQQTKLREQAARLNVKDAEIAALRDSVAQQESAIQTQDQRMLQMEMALAELQRYQADEIRVSSSN